MIAQLWSKFSFLDKTSVYVGFTQHVQESHIDEANKVITAPAFMFGDAPLHDIFDGIGNMIAGVMRFMIKK